MKNSLNKPGFTLIELAVVMLLISIMFAAAVPAYVDSIIVHRVQSAALRLKADIELTQHDAKATSEQRSITYDGANTLTIASLSDLVQNGKTYTWDVTKPPYEVAIAQFDFAGQAVLTFNGYGIPTHGGAITLQSGKYSKTIVVDGGTGEVTIQN